MTSVLYVTERYLPAIGGVEVYTSQLAENMCRRGFSVEVWSTCVSRNYAEVINGVSTRKFAQIRIPMLFSRVARELYYRQVMEKPLQIGNNITPVDYIEGLVINPLSPSMLLEVVLRQDFDILHSTGTMGSEHWYAFLASRKQRKPWVMSPFFHLNIPFFYKPCLIKASRNASAILVSSNIEKEFFVKYGVSKEKVHVVAAAVDPKVYENANPDRFREKYGIGEAPVVLFLGRISFYKGFYHVLSAMRHVVSRIPDAKLVVLDTGQNLDTSRLAPDLQKCLVYLGALTGKDKVDALAASSVLAMPSIDEALGIVYLEAWCCRKPVIAADTPLMRELIESSRGGIFVPFGDTRALALSIATILHEPKLREAMGINGFKKVLSQYTCQIVYERVMSIYTEVLR